MNIADNDVLREVLAKERQSLFSRGP